MKNIMKIYYGQSYSNSIDVTDVCLTRLKQNNIITIPSGDYNRANYFTDPFYGITKIIIISNDDNNLIIEFDDSTEIKINLINNTITTTNENNIIMSTNNKLKDIQFRLNLKYGTFDDELPEQKMAVRFLTGNEKVLEIGGNIGRNSLIISHILHDDSKLVTLESDANIAKQLIENKDSNNCNFHVENSALSKRKLIQRGWDTKPSDTLQEGYEWVNTITIDDLKNKYNIEFDTLVLDCEGAFYYILMDMPEILNNINLIIMENDYHDISHKMYIDKVLLENNFILHYIESGGWGPCYNNFFEVWKKMF